jgi:hypothetical protein
MVAAKTLSQFRADQNDEGAELIADVLDDILSNNDDATEVKTEEEA